MKEYRDEGFHLEIFFVFADEDVMEKRAEQRAKKTGRHTGRKHVCLTPARPLSANSLETALTRGNLLMPTDRAQRAGCAPVRAGARKPRFRRPRAHD